MNDTLKKLRIKFVAIIMAVVTLVLAVVFTTIVVLNYNESTAQVYGALDEAIARNSVVQGAEPLDRSPFAPERPGSDALVSEMPEEDQVPRFEIGGHEPERSLIPVAVYELSGDGTLSLLTDAASGTMADSTLEEATELMDDLPDGRGFIDSLGVFYLKETRGDAVFVAFADEQSVTGWKSLALNLLFLGLGALVFFFIVSLLFSKWALRPVEESWKQQQRFIADASHELKTPLTVMAADVSIIKQHYEESIASQSQWVESIESEITEMHDLVSDMLALAQADSENAPVDGQHQEHIDLSKLVNADSLQFEPLAYERSIAFMTNIEESVCVSGQQNKLQRLVSVLFDNAFKYVDDRGSISVSLAKRTDRAIFSITNSGMPIAADDIPYIFDRFYRSDAARARTEGKSYGLGLSIAYEIALAHKGTIRVTSNEAEGTTFIVTLPCS